MTQVHNLKTNRKMTVGSREYNKYIALGFENIGGMLHPPESDEAIKLKEERRKQTLNVPAPLKHVHGLTESQLAEIIKLINDIEEEQGLFDKLMLEFNTKFEERQQSLDGLRQKMKFYFPYTAPHNPI